MRSSKSRSRNKSNRNRPNSVGNVVNRVFDSSGPEGKVRGTPQQIIEKYNQLARDAQLSNDRVAAENFQQHAEHYLRLLGEAQKELDAKRDQDAKREQQERENRERQAERDRERAQQNERSDGGNGAQSDQVDHRDNRDSKEPREDAQPQEGEGDSTLVETPESKATPRRAPRKPRAKPGGNGQEGQSSGGDQGQSGGNDEASGDAPRPKQRRARKPKADHEASAQGDTASPTDTAAE